MTQSYFVMKVYETTTIERIIWLFV